MPCIHLVYNQERIKPVSHLLPHQLRQLDVWSWKLTISACHCLVCHQWNSVCPSIDMRLMTFTAATEIYRSAARPLQLPGGRSLMLRISASHLVHCMCTQIFTPLHHRYWGHGPYDNYATYKMDQALLVFSIDASSDFFPRMRDIIWARKAWVWGYIASSWCKHN